MQCPKASLSSLGASVCFSGILLCVPHSHISAADFSKTDIVQVPDPGQTPESEPRLGKVIRDLQGGKFDYDEMEPLLQITAQQQEANVLKTIKRLGRLKRIEYMGVQYTNDIYRVTFENGITAWIIKISPNKKIEYLAFQ